MLVVSTSGEIIDANRRASGILQRRTEELVGQAVERVLAPSQAIGAALEADDARSKCSMRLPDGRQATIGFSVSEAHLSGGVVWVVVFQDITDVEALREERDRLLRLAAVSEVLPAILHEVKNPLAAVTTSVEVILEELAPGQLQTDLHAVLGEIRRMKLTLEGLSSVGRELLSSRYYPVDFELREVLSVVRRQADSRGIRVRASIPDMPLLPFEPGVVRAVLFNLVTNAVHASSAGEEIEVSANVISCALSGPSRLQITVRDHGHGMTQDVLQRCRELFFTTKSRGTGIGLSLCAEAVEGASGVLRIDSAAGGGTTVELSIPIPDNPRLLVSARLRSNESIFERNDFESNAYGSVQLPA